MIKYIAALFCFFCSAATCWASIDFVFTTGDPITYTQSLAADSNNCPIEGPIAAYVAGTVTNSGATTVSNITATLTGLTGSFSMTGTQTGTLDVGSLAPNTTTIIGWHITYPCDTSKKSQPGPSTTATIAVTDGNGGNFSQTITLYSRKAISANAGGNVLSTVLGAGAIVGQTITADVVFDFGGNSAGDEFFTQPAGNTDFDAACLQLIKAEVLSSNILAAPAGTLNTMYFVSSTSQTGNGYFIEMRFFYRYLCANTVSTARPYAVQTSGNTNIKYTGNYDGAGALVFDFPTSTNPFIVTKTVTPDTFIAGSGSNVATYTVSIENPSIHDAIIDGITDSLPPNVSFIGLHASSDVTAANSGSLPGTGDTGMIEFIGLTGASYEILSTETLTLVFTATVPDTVDTYINSASGVTGPTILGTDTATFEVGTAEISADKTVSIYDPLNAGLYAIPGNEIIYTFTLTNTGTLDVDGGTIILVDPLPDDIAFYNGDFDPANVGMGPFFVEPGASGLACCGVGEVDYSISTSAPIIYGENPSSGYDTDITHIKFTPSKDFVAGETMKISFRALIE